MQTKSKVCYQLMSEFSAQRSIHLLSQFVGTDLSQASLSKVVHIILSLDKMEYNREVNAEKVEVI
jgi:hypothetical protein